MSDNPLVFSTDGGRIKPTTPQAQAPETDGIVRIRRETKGRKGKGVTTISGVPLQGEELKALAKALKQRCGTGGALKQNIIEIQGDHREVIKDALEQRGYTVKLAGG
ncbi:stress response translation initiation inhibitor YciH [Aestuariibacter halophilus]|uniref:Stress response translation initiation inhibitor YciH n=1 Tax=Fluctibacter halophilus TaxID=226011 RepID=A0ABS8G3X4_9ALTE|nr:stress response translation initiation inhibitor YciH [Aestuariibacter halophilus]MCC2615199.1 stress response translation initiation inhibitor YciH [Aestuariibacter halophilus]